MKCGVRVAMGVAGGYLLGRTKKMKLAMMLGGMAAGRRAGGPGELLAQGSKLLERSPELAALTDQIRGRLLDAGKGAAMAVAARQVESLTDRVGKRVESLGDLGAPKRRPAETADDVEEVDEADDRAEDSYADDQAGDEPDARDAGADAEVDEPPADEPAEKPAPPRRPRTAKATGTAKAAGGAGGKAAGRAASAGRNVARAGSKAKAGRRTSDA